jgi:hypothetical protein
MALLLSSISRNASRPIIINTYLGEGEEVPQTEVLSQKFNGIGGVIYADAYPIIHRGSILVERSIVTRLGSQ